MIMIENLKSIEERISELKWFANGSELTINVKLKGMSDSEMDDIAGFFDFKSKRKAVDYLRKLKTKYKE